MKPAGIHPRDVFVPGCRLDLREPQVSLAWRAVLMRFESYSQSDGMAALLLKDCAGQPKSLATAPLLKRVRRRLPMLVSSTREVDISGALAAAMPLIGAGPGLTPSWDDFLMGYLCGLKTSPLLDDQRLQFLWEFGNAMMTESACTTSASRTWIERTVRGDGLPWIRVVLDAISCGRIRRSASLAERALRVGHTSGTDSMFGALLGSSLWKTCPHEVDLMDRLGGFPTCTPQSDEVQP